MKTYAISIDPDILIIDEALAVGDGLFQQKCFSRLHDFQQAGKTIVLVTHDPQVVTRHCSRTIVIEYGAVLCDTTPMEAVSRYYEVLYGEGPPHSCSPSQRSASLSRRTPAPGSSPNCSRSGTRPMASPPARTTRFRRARTASRTSRV
jgi:energy-coupling factor transporter ATP-binding protein EcfA2